MIKNIIFDIGGVLVDFEPERTLKEMGLSQSEVDIIARFTALGPHWKELDRGVMKKEDVFELMISEVPQEYKNNARKFLYEETLKTVKSRNYSKNWLAELKAKGFNIYLLTNYPEWMFNEHWKNVFTFTDSVDGKIVSGKEKVIKPDAEIYNLILNTYSLKAEESIFIDDRLENIEAANKIGIHGIQFTTLEEVKEKICALVK